MLPSFSLAGKVCLVTGAARGLGYEFCRAFIQSGCKSLAILDLNEAEAKNAAQELEAYGNGDVKVLGIGCDVASEESVQNAYAQVVDTFHQVDSVVASAGIVETISALEYPVDRMKRLYDINVHGAFYTAREAAKVMIPRGSGSIILIASMSANVRRCKTSGPEPVTDTASDRECATGGYLIPMDTWKEDKARPQTQMPYNASKAAVKHMAASLAVEWAEHGVRVNTLSPGYMMTNLTRAILADQQELKRTWEELTPMKRMGEPEDLSGAIVFLASDASKFVTGTEIRVDGGYCAV